MVNVSFQQSIRLRAPIANNIIPRHRLSAFLYFFFLSPLRKHKHNIFSLPHPSINAVLLSLAFSPSFINVGVFLWEQRGALKGLCAGLREGSLIQCLKTKGGSRLFFFPSSSFFPQKSQSTDPMQCPSAGSLNVSLFASEDKNSSVEERRDACRLWRTAGLRLWDSQVARLDLIVSSPIIVENPPEL